MSQITDAAQAKHLVEVAQKHSVYNAEMPVDDQGVISLANQLYSMAVQAKEKGMDAVQINDVIAAGQSTAPAAVASPTPAPAAAPEPVPAPPAPLATPAKVKIRSAADGAVYEIDASQVEEYTVGGAYTVVEEAHPVPPTPPAPAPVEPQPPVATPEPTPEPVPAAVEQPAPAPDAAQPTAAADPSEYQSVEPWDGYKKLNIKPIMAEIEQRMQAGDPNLNTLLFHVFEYEKANKGRERLLAKLKELAENGVAASAAPAPAAPEPAPAPVPAAAPTTPPVAAPAPVAQDPDVVPGSPFAGAVEAPAPVAAPPVAAPVPAAAAPAVQQVVGQAVEAAVTHVQSGGATLVAPLEGATQKSIQAIVAERLPIPSEIDGDAPTLPADFTTLSDQEVARLQSQFNACLARANWLGAVADGHSNDAKIIADGKTREYKAANPAPKGTTVDQLEAQAYAAVPEIAAARTVQSEWGQHGRLLHALCNTFQSNCERLSREQTRRSDERATAK